jgi:hypothetical protein
MKLPSPPVPLKLQLSFFGKPSTRLDSVPVGSFLDNVGASVFDGVAISDVFPVHPDVDVWHV